jgi:hypothetical protein
VTRWLWEFLRRRVREQEIATRLTREEAIEIARRHLDPDGELFMPGAEAEKTDGRIVWRVVTHVGFRGGHSQVYVDDETGKVIHTHHVEL